jgi:hypothetical protein
VDLRLIGATLVLRRVGLRAGSAEEVGAMGDVAVALWSDISLAASCRFTLVSIFNKAGLGICVRLPRLQ